MTINTGPASPAAGERTMWDSVNLRAITLAKRGDIIAYYLNDGRYAVPSIAYVEDLFDPDKYRLAAIDTVGDRADFARILDVEKNLVDPGKCEQWLQDFAASNPSYEGGGRGEIYCNRSTIGAVRIGTGRYRLGRDYYLWVATGDGTLYRAFGVNACQDTWRPTYDSSVVYDPRFMPGDGLAA